MWDKILNVNLKGTFLMCKYILPLIIKGGQGRVINISSIHGKNPPSMRTAYSASKFGVIGLSQALSKEVAKHSICVNTICPGPVKSDMLDDIWKETASRSGITYEEFSKIKLREIPLGKLCEPKDISGAVLFLLSESSKHITGSTIDINGGAV
jgi:NAD(P)-dependent dehydrogenase (short-subunit alcohol dehydrogenase family)